MIYRKMFITIETKLHYNNSIYYIDIKVEFFEAQIAQAEFGKVHKLIQVEYKCQ